MALSDSLRNDGDTCDNDDVPISMISNLQLAAGHRYLRSEISEAFSAVSRRQLVNFGKFRLPNIKKQTEDIAITKPHFFQKLAGEIRTEIYKAYLGDLNNIPAAIDMGDTLNWNFIKPVRNSTIDLSILHVSRIIRAEVLQLFKEELATRLFVFRYHDHTMLQSTLEQAMLRRFGNCIERASLTCPSLRCMMPVLQVFGARSLKILTIDRRMSLRVVHDMDDSEHAEDVAVALEDDLASCVNNIVVSDTQVKALLASYANFAAANPAVFVLGRQWRVKALVGVRLQLDDQRRQEDFAWEVVAAVDLEWGAVVEAWRGDEPWGW
jgi:hypothetical protein